MEINMNDTSCLNASDEAKVPRRSPPASISKRQKSDPREDRFNSGKRQRIETSDGGDEDDDSSIYANLHVL